MSKDTDTTQDSTTTEPTTDSNKEWTNSLRKIAIQQFVQNKLQGQVRNGRFGARYEKPLTGSKLNYALSDVLEVLNAFEGNVDLDADSSEKLKEQLKNVKP